MLRPTIVRPFGSLGSKYEIGGVWLALYNVVVGASILLAPFAFLAFSFDVDKLVIRLIFLVTLVALVLSLWAVTFKGIKVAE